MADDTEDQPKSIRDSIEEAWTEVEPDEAAPEKPAPRRPAPEEREPDELGEGIEERPRDERGRFVRQEGEPEEEKSEQPAKPAPKPRQEGEQPEAAPVEEPQKDETREQRLAKLTKNWRADHREFLNAQPPEVQDFLAERDAEMNVAFNRKAQRVAHLETEYGPIAAMLEPDLPAIRAAGYSPRLLIEGWASAERALLSGPQQAAATLRHIAEGYQIPRELVAMAFGFDVRTPQEIAMGGQMAQQPQQEVMPPNGNGYIQQQPLLDPRVDQLLAERKDWQERAIIMRNQQFRAAAGQAQQHINEFRDETDARGNLKHPFFAEVEDHMTMLAQYYGQKTGRVPPLKQLYEDAVNANPATRAKLVAASQRAQSDRQRQEVAARGKTEQARRASSSVVGMGSGRPNNRTQEQGLPKGASIRASIDAAMAAHSDQE